MSPHRFGPDAVLIQGRNAAGEATTVKLNDDGTLAISASISGADGATLDGVDSGIKATVFDKTNSNPLATAIVDSNGDQVSSFGGGTQYTEDDVDTSITGTAALAEGPSNVLTPLQVDSSKQLKVIEPSAASRLSESDFDTKIGSLTETAPATDAASSGLNGRLQRIAQRLTSLIALLPTALGTGGGLKVDGSGTALPVSTASLPLPSGAATESTLGGVLTTSDFDTKVGSLTETAPSTDTASSGLNGRLQRIAQRLTSLITALGSPFQAGGSIGNTSFASTVADGANVTLGAKADAKSTATDTTAITAMSVWKQISASVQLMVFGAGTAAAAQRTTLASDDPAVATLGATTGAAVITDANGTIQQYLRGIVKLAITVGGWLVTASGDVAHDGVDSGNPMKVGGKAVSSEPAAVSAGDRTNFLTDLVGKLIVILYANPENFVSGCISSAMTGTTSTSLLAAPASGLRNYITQITISNSHATVGTDLEIQDGSGGTTFYVIPAAAVYGGAAITFPTPLRQPSTATAVFCKNTTTGANTRVSASGYKGA